jgi:hypothetical protein
MISTPLLPHTPLVPGTCLGTWIVHNLDTRDSISRLIALSHFMHYNGVGVLAVQDTVSRSRLPVPVSAKKIMLLHR